MNLGVSGQTVSAASSGIATIIAAVPATDPVTVVLLNWGVNDIRFQTLVESTWKAQYLTIIDAVHARWPDAHVYLALPWVTGYDAGCDTLATWIGDIQASRSSFVSIGHDERVWLKGADNGATMTSDGVHYSTAGKNECAAQWRTAMGY